MESQHDAIDGHLLPLKPAVLLILTALAEKPRHGYAIMLAVRQQSGGRVELGTSHLYRNLKKLLDQGLVSPSSQTDEEDPRRRYYQLSELGRRVLRAEMRRLQDILKLGRNLGILDPAEAAR
ncbi:MAG: PadR family transcriptional regulator [Acidobacteriota bacterium]